MYTNPYLRSNNSMSYISSQSLLNEKMTDSLQKEIDKYTFKIEQEKRRTIAIEDTYQITQQEYHEAKKHLVQITKKSNIIDKSIKKRNDAALKNLENDLQKKIKAIDEAEAENHLLMQQIDKLRKQRYSNVEICKDIKIDMETNSDKFVKHLEQIEQVAVHSQQAQNDIEQMKLKNDQDKKDYFQQFDYAQKGMQEEKKQKGLAQLKEAAAKRQQIEIVDVHAILKERLKKIIANNQEKVKVIEQYQKSMQIIDEAFNQIKEGSGISDIEEITNTFIKSEEQNYSLYNYVDILSQDIDNLEDNIKQLQDKFKKQENENKQKEIQARMTPPEEQRKQKLVRNIEEEEKKIDKFRNSIQTIQDDLESTLKALGNTQLNNNKKQLFDYQIGFDLTETNIELYLADLEDYINMYVEFKTSNNNANNTTLLLDQIQPKENRGYIKPVDDHLIQDFLDDRDNNSNFLTQTMLEKQAKMKIEQKSTKHNIVKNE